MSTPELFLRTAFVLDGRGRIRHTREPEARPGPLFALVRGRQRCAWAVHAGVTDELAGELARLAREEQPLSDLRAPPRNAGRLQALVLERCGPATIASGPAFTFPETLPPPGEIVTIDDERLLAGNFRGWVPGEIAAGRAPVCGVIAGGEPLSICFCARSSDVAAEAGVETAAPFRRRGFAARATSAWATAIRATGRVPLYSTDWSNEASLALARSLGLVAYASTWSIVAPDNNDWSSRG